VTTIRRVRFTPPAPDVVDIEVTTLAAIRERGGREEFVAPQRLDFDLLIRIERGETVHAVDFHEHVIGPGDVLWVRAGQVQQWGHIEHIDGPVALFDSFVIDVQTQRLVKGPGIGTHSHWPASSVADISISRALDALFVGEPGEGRRGSDLVRAALAHTLAAALLQLVRVQSEGQEATPATTHETVARFRDELEENFSKWHHVTEYAHQLGYSTRTLNGHVRSSTGLSAKDVIDERVALEAKRLLAHTDAPIGAIAEDLGFDDASNFTNYFRRTVGTTPTAFRADRRSPSRR